MDIPQLGLGTWKSPNNDDVTNAVRYAIEEAGYTHIDCAAIYGNEKYVGIALKDVLSRGVIKRENLWVTSKLWCTKHHPDDVEAACRQTLADLQLDYIDLYLIHWPMAFKRGNELFPKDENGNMIQEIIPLVDTWKAMEKLVEKGLVRHIGGSNFTIELLEKLIKQEEVSIRPYANQVETHLFLQQEPMIEYCEKRGIHVIGYSTLGTSDSAKPDMPVLLKDPVLNEVAQETGKSPAQVELKFLHKLSAKNMLSTLAKSVTPERIKANNQLDFDLTDEQVARLRKRDRCFRYCDMFKMRNIEIFGDHW
ncbi:oxidoreductase, aldo/keto reductase family protein [Tritrichomonas foetus]|uniref:Oxidoreductase, aldo/keto reductase family protein n=1 Tax=Tritrichomonas foetus TaxID=1144522 RepID=A0A1J4JYG5_9EUKA|nr:oxidoreductase, aldo/keto reductase family protein [Tritrichomonas foetus]|eukprot:OHT02534.1 oxidoreductase, aldo/keto reductase family protein [Tritrichomonas foetus]